MIYSQKRNNTSFWRIEKLKGGLQDYIVKILKQEKMEFKKCDFERGECIGKGGFGKVFLCFDKKDRQKKVT